MKNRGTIELGPSVIVTNPCYKVGTWCQGELNVLPGTYRCGLLTYNDPMGHR